MFSYSVLKHIVRRRTVLDSLRGEVSKHRANSIAFASRLCREPVKPGGNASNINNGMKHLSGIRRKTYSTLTVELEKGLDIEDIYPRYEDTFAHMVMTKDSRYARTTVAAPSLGEGAAPVTREEVDQYATQSWKAREIPEIVEAFERISFYAREHNESLIDPKYQKLLKYIATNCRKFTDSELSRILRSILVWPLNHTTKDPAFKELYAALDDVCYDRTPLWSTDEKLYFCDHWYRLRLIKFTKYYSNVLEKMVRKTRRFTPENLVQFLFYVNVGRRKLKGMIDVEARIEESLKEFTLNELAVVSMGFFKTNTMIYSRDIVREMISRTINEIDTVHEITLTAFLKILRLSSMRVMDSNIIWELLVSTLPQLDRLSLQCVVHITMTAAKLRFYYPEMLNRIFERFTKDMKMARIKDLERLLLGLTMFSYTPPTEPTIYQQIVEELRDPSRREEIERYPKSVDECLAHLSLMDVYPVDLISKSLDDERRERVYGKTSYELRYSVYVLDLNVESEVPDYRGPRLSDVMRRRVAKDHVLFAPKPDATMTRSKRDEFLMDVRKVCQDVLGSEDATYTGHVLPQHPGADIIVCLGENDEAIPVENLLSELPFGSIKRPPITTKGARWLAIVIGDRNIFLKDSTRLRGKELAKLRQLERIGYAPKVIPFYEWKEQGARKEEYIRRVLFE